LREISGRGARWATDEGHRVLLLGDQEEYGLLLLLFFFGEFEIEFQDKWEIRRHTVNFSSLLILY
jgi:hypothetical protein